MAVFAGLGAFLGNLCTNLAQLPDSADRGQDRPPVVLFTTQNIYKTIANNPINKSDKGIFTP